MSLSWGERLEKIKMDSASFLRILGLPARGPLRRDLKGLTPEKIKKRSKVFLHNSKRQKH